MRPRDLVALEFPRVCVRVADFAASAVGKQACHILEPTTDRATAELGLERTWQCFQLLEQHGNPPLSPFPDVRAHLRAAAHEGIVLDGKALVEVRTLLEAVRTVGAFFRRHVDKTSALADIPVELLPLPTVESSLARALDHDGNVLDQASDELAGIRTTIRRLRDRLTKRLESLVSNRSLTDTVADTYVTLRNNRFVVPIRAGALGRLPGVVQDRSVSGETFFVEPLFAVELNNQLLMAVREEEAIIRRILGDLTALVGAQHEAIASRVTALAAVDCLNARAQFSRSYQCTRPTFTDGAIRVRDARHPGLLFTGRPVTPVDLTLPADHHVLVIAGPNTGGKTVALKTLGLCALMAQSGLLIPAADGAGLPFVPAVFADMGDDQNIERDLSTFSAHIANLCEICAAECVGPLVLLDEPGVGTDPEEGAALAIGLIEHLEQLGARVMLTTHYTPVKLFALGRATCTLAAVDFDVDSLTPRYRLVYDSFGRSLGLPIARRLGLPEPVLAAAMAIQPEQSRAFATALEQLETTRRQLEGRLATAAAHTSDLAAQETESQQLLTTLRERRQAAWREGLREARDFVRDLKAEGRALLRGLNGVAKERADLERFIREKEHAVATHDTQQSAAAEPAVSPGPLQVGDTVEVGERGIRGELLSVDGARSWIQRGSLRFEVPTPQLRRIDRPSPAAPAVHINVPSSDGDTDQEISIIGLRTRDAVRELESFLDRAVQGGQPSVRIVHGVGSGALRQAVHDYLSNSPYCTGFRAGETREGGASVTIAIVNL